MVSLLGKEELRGTKKGHNDIKDDKITHSLSIAVA